MRPTSFFLLLFPSPSFKNTKFPPPENGHILLVMLLVTISVASLGALEPTLPQYWLTESYTTNPLLIGVTFSGWAAGYVVMMPLVRKLSCFFVFTIKLRRLTFQTHPQAHLSNWLPSYSILFLGMVIIAVSFPAVRAFSFSFFFCPTFFTSLCFFQSYLYITLYLAVIPLFTYGCGVALVHFSAVPMVAALPPSFHFFHCGDLFVCLS